MGFDVTHSSTAELRMIPLNRLTEGAPATCRQSVRAALPHILEMRIVAAMILDAEKRVLTWPGQETSADQRAIPGISLRSRRCERRPLTLTMPETMILRRKLLIAFGPVPRSDSSAQGHEAASVQGERDRCRRPLTAMCCCQGQFQNHRQSVIHGRRDGVRKSGDTAGAVVFFFGRRHRRTTLG